MHQEILSPAQDNCRAIKKHLDRTINNFTIKTHEDILRIIHSTDRTLRLIDKEQYHIPKLPNELSQPHDVE